LEHQYNATKIQAQTRLVIRMVAKTDYTYYLRMPLMDACMAKDRGIAHHTVQVARLGPMRHSRRQCARNCIANLLARDDAK
jgi:hypothetical protein